MISGRIITIFYMSFIIAQVFTAPAELKDNDLKANEVQNEKSEYKKGVSAEWGGYSASASLGGGSAGGGLYASAGAKGGNGFYAGDAGGRPVYPEGAGFFDRIFAIPINVLHSVNDHLNTRGSYRPGYVRGEGPAGAGLGASASVGNIGASAGLGGAAVEPAGVRFGSYVASGPQGVHERPVKSSDHYDRVFNIPITALKSVNDFLNG